MENVSMLRPPAVLLCLCVGGFKCGICFMFIFSSSLLFRCIGKAVLRRCDNFLGTFTDTSATEEPPWSGQQESYWGLTPVLLAQCFAFIFDPDKHTTSQQRRHYVTATSWRCRDVVMTLLPRCVLARTLLQITKNISVRLGIPYLFSEISSLNRHNHKH